MSLFTNTLSAMVSLFIFIMIGWILKTCKIIPDDSDMVISKLENYLFKPALIIKTFMTYCNRENFVLQSRLFVFTAVGLSISVALAFLLARLMCKDDIDERKIYRYSFVFPNSSFIGYAIVPMLLGEEALYGFILFNLPSEVLCNSWGYTQLIPEKTNGKRNSLAKRIFNPCFISLIIGILLGITGAADFIPEFVKNAIGNIGACMSPLAMILTGVVIASYPISKLLTKYKVYIAALFRLVIIPAIILSVFFMLTRSSDVIIYATLTYTMPFGLNGIIVPKAYGGNPEIGAAEAIIGDVLGIITIPLMYVAVDYLLRALA